jgi:NAD(P)-dependent dehydrogenase (short-subunit alcohol dehydrogenase family)
MEQLRFDGRVVLITGAGRGMGKVHAEILAGRGAKVIVSDVGTSMLGEGKDTAVAEEVAAAIRKSGGDAISYTGDLSSEAGARGAVKAALDKYGKIDAIIHNAGIALGGLEFGDETVERLDKLLNVNIRAGYAMMFEAWPVMKKQKYGRIVLIGSTGMYGITQGVSYGAAKASYMGLIRCLAEEADGLGIKINAVMPSGVSRLSEAMPDSEFTRWFLKTMKPELVTAVVGLLAHEKCPVAGESLAIAGGRVARIMFAETKGYVNKNLTMEDVLSNMNQIMDTKTPLTGFPTYPSSVECIMKDLGFQQTEKVGAIATPQSGG